MDKKPYYTAYEHRYQKAYEAGAERWGHSPTDGKLVAALTSWVDFHDLRGKRVIDFGCGEGAAGEILCQLGCAYHGIDIAPSAVERARKALSAYPSAQVSVLDMVEDDIAAHVGRDFDAALDVMGLHMLVIDADRAKYLENALRCLSEGAPMLFFRESYERDAWEGEVKSFQHWLEISGDDYTTSERRLAKSAEGNDKEVEVYVPKIPARAKFDADYVVELTEAGFHVFLFEELDLNGECPYSAAIHAVKP